MLTGFANGELVLEERGALSGDRRLRGRFPYNKAAVLSDGGRNGRPRKEIIASRAFAYRVDKPDEDIHLLVGHSYDRPLASRGAGTLTLKDSDEALTFDATITAEMQDVSWVKDVLSAIGAGLIIGLSPGFRIPPERAVKNAEKVTSEGSDPANGMHDAIIRTIFAALLFELSLVTRPAYPDTEVEARNWTPTPEARVLVPKRHLNRWRV